MKNLIKYFFSILILCSFFLSCKAKEIAVKTDKIENKISDQKEFINQKQTINQAIIDSLSFHFAQIYSKKPECDSLINASLQQALQQINAYKKSGDNEYILRYNQLSNKLEMQIKIAETKSQKLDSLIIDHSFSETKESIEIPIEKPLPKWQKGLILTGILSILIWLLILSFWIRKKLITF